MILSQNYAFRQLLCNASAPILLYKPNHCFDTDKIVTYLIFKNN